MLPRIPHSSPHTPPHTYTKKGPTLWTKIAPAKSFFSLGETDFFIELSPALKTEVSRKTNRKQKDLTLPLHLPLGENPQVPTHLDPGDPNFFSSLSMGPEDWQVWEKGRWEVWRPPSGWEKGKGDGWVNFTSGQLLFVKNQVRKSVEKGWGGESGWGLHLLCWETSVQLYSEASDTSLVSLSLSHSWANRVLKWSSTWTTWDTFKAGLHPRSPGAPRRPPRRCLSAASRAQ